MTKKNKTLQILHLSDIHVDSAEHYVLSRFEKIIPAINASQSSSPQLIIVTGDVVYAGTKKEFDAITPHLRRLEEDIFKTNGEKPEWVFVPGNHDGQFKKSQLGRKYIIEGLAKNDGAEIDQSIIDACTEPENDFFNFKKEFENSSTLVHADKLLSIHQILIGNKTLQIWAFNVSWTS